MSSLIKKSINISTGHGWNKYTGKQREAQAKARKDAIYTNADMPDEELIKRNERRKAARRRGSRVSTILTDEDSLG